MRLVTVFAFTENVTIREKDSSMSSEMNVSLLLSYFCGKQNGGWGSSSLRYHDGNAAWARECVLFFFSLFLFFFLPFF